MLLLLFSLALLWAQRAPFTFLDMIEDPDEREALLAWHEAEDFSERRRLAEEYARRYPESHFLAQTWEAAAKAAFDLGDHEAALRYARDSLRLWPENRTLLTLSAAIHSEAGNKEEAAWNATLALESLDRFRPPESIPSEEWAAHEPVLRASANLVLGRLIAAEGLAASGAERSRKLREAEALFLAAYRVQPGDSRTAYLLGLTQVAQSKIDEAAVAYASAYRTGGPFASKARDQLLKICEVRGWAFETLLDKLESVDSAPEETDEPAKEENAPLAKYAGSEVCRSCHERHYDGWAGTGHARMFRPYKFENVSGDFEDQTYKDATETVVARMIHDDENHYFRIRGSDGRWNRYRVDYTIGSKWQQTYATRLPNGIIHAFPLQYNMLQKRWVAFWRDIDPPGTARGEATNFPRMSADTAYLSNCGPCHTSQLGSRDPGSNELIDLTFREGGVNCEMCHGPSQRHVLSMLKGRPEDGIPLEILQHTKLSSRERVAICAQCHLQSAWREMGPHGEMNYQASPNHENFYVSYRSSSYSDFARRAFHKDGRFRVVSFVVESFIRSKCYLKGDADCGFCHEHHPDDPASNDRGLKYLDDPDQMCLQCHPGYRERLEAHTRHKAASDGSRCTGCHMPKIMNTVLFKTMTHKLDDIPDAELTARFGPVDSPNACLICHPDESIDWLQDQLSDW